MSTKKQVYAYIYICICAALALLGDGDGERERDIYIYAYIHRSLYAYKFYAPIVIHLFTHLLFFNIQV